MDDTVSRHYRFAGYCLDTQSRELRDAQDHVIPLTAKAFDTLCVLIANRDRLMGKHALLAAVWPARVVEENNLTQAVAALRRAFGTDGSDHRYIVTVPGRGYRFVAEVREGQKDAPDPPLVAARSSHQSAATLLPAWQLLAGSGALLFMLGLFAATAWQSPGPPAAVNQAVPRQAALAVLPFRWLSPPPRDELLELGLAETLVVRLSRSNALRVRTVASAQRVADARHDPLVSGRKLGADYVVDGSIQRDGDRVRVSARLLSVTDGSAAWADTFDTRLDRAFTLQDDIAAAVTSALALQRIEIPAHARSACDGDDPAAFRAYLRGRYLLERPTHERLARALAEFRRAIELDPTCSRAYAGMALTYRGLPHLDRDPREVFPLAKAAVAQALRIDPGSAEALVSQGRNQQLYDWAWMESEASLKRAIALNPSLMEAHFAYAHLLAGQGRFDEALSHARQARDLDPLSPLINTLEAGFLTAAQRPDEAHAALQRALELQPDFWIALLIRGGMALDRGDHAAAIADLSRAAERSRRASQVVAMLAVAHAAAGDRTGAQAIRRELEARDAAGYVPATSLGAVRNALGETDAALDLLERAYQERDIRLAFLGVDARWNNLRSHPRFRALAGRLRLNPGPAAGRY